MTQHEGIIRDLHGAITSGTSLVDIAWIQHRFHESRRWSLTELIGRVDPAKVDPAMKRNIWNAGRAELTAKPGADRLSKQA